MAFWNNGDTITADKLNTAAAMYIFHETVNSDTGVFSTPDKTYTEVLAAFNNGMVPIVHVTDSYTNSIYIEMLTGYQPSANKLIFGDLVFQYSSSTGFGDYSTELIDVN